MTPPPPFFSPEELRDAKFMASITEAGVAVNSRDEAVHAGHGACAHLAIPGNDFGSLIVEVRNSQPLLSADDAGTFIALAVESYCPDKKPG